MIVCIGFADLGIDQMCALVDESPAGAFDYDSIIHRIPKRKTPLRVSSFLVDSKGIEPSNLTDANRALSQLSYEPICNFLSHLTAFVL